MQFEIIDIFARGDNQIKTLTYSYADIASLNPKLLNDSDRNRFHELGCEKRKAEFFFTRILWQHFDAYQEIEYNENGKPQIKNGFLSISHSKNVVAISFGRRKHVGVDVEHYNPKIRRILQKFSSKKEQKQLEIIDDQVITTIWSIKEAVYKMIGTPGLSFKNEMDVLQIGEKNIINVLIPNKGWTPFEFQRLIYDDYLLTYCEIDSHL